MLFLEKTSLKLRFKPRPRVYMTIAIHAQQVPYSEYPIITETSTWNLCPNLNPLPKKLYPIQTELYSLQTVYIRYKPILPKIPLFKPILFDTNRLYPIQPILPDTNRFYPIFLYSIRLCSNTAIISYFSYYLGKGWRTTTPTTIILLGPRCFATRGQKYKRQTDFILCKPIISETNRFYPIQSSSNDTNWFYPT